MSNLPTGIMTFGETAEDQSPFRGFGPGGLQLDTELAQPTHPSALRFLDYCEARRGPSGLLRRCELDPRDLAPMLPDLFIAEPTDGDWRYRLAGGTIVLQGGLEFTGRRLRQICAPHTAEAARRLYDSVVRRRQPTTVSSSYTIGRDRTVVFEAVQVPMLARDETSVHVFGGMFFF